MEKTERGFSFLKFKDSYDENCSIQMSSAASDDYIWLGIDHPKILEEGYDSEYPGRCRELTENELKEKHYLVFGRMHLNKQQVKMLLPYLIKFAETGELK